MQMRLLISLVLIGGVLTGCVSLSDYQKLQRDYDDYKKTSLEKQEQLAAKVEAFVNDYDPQLHEKLQSNLAAVIESRREVQTVMNDIELVVRKISDLSRSAQKDREGVAEILKDITVRNIVAEFSELKARWEQTLIGNTKAATSAAEASNKAQLSALQAAERSGAAAQAADTATAAAQDAARKTAAIPDLVSQLNQLQALVKKLQSQAGSGLPNDWYVVLDRRLSSLEKTIKDLSSKENPQKEK